MPNFAMSGTADFSQIETKLQALQSQINSLKVPPIQVANPNFGSFFAACDAAEKKATINVKSVIEPPTTIGGGFSSFLNSEKGKFANVGKEMGQSLQMGMQQQFGMAGGVASSLGGALGGVAIAGMAVVGGLALVGSAATQAAMKWEDMKTSIGRTTGLKGGDLEDLMSQLQDLRQEFGVTAEAASSMVEQAGSIGVGQSKLNVGDISGYKQEILDFTKSIAQIQGAWGMSAEATSSGIGKMGSVTLGAWNVQRKARGEEEMSWADYAYKVGGTTDNLANAMGSSEEEIVTAMRNASGAVAKFAPSEETYGKWQAMASFLIDTGSSAGEAGTQIERVAQKMDQNSADIAKVMGIDQTSLSANLKTDFMGTVQDLGEAIAAMPESARPDTAKMFGLEGKVMIDKVVADIEAGTGKLQNAYDLALKPGNVAKGYEDVADNASKAFSRIGQAFQVSLERIGGQLLPIVTDLANGIADAWIAANEAGSKLFVAGQSAIANSDARIKNAVENGGGLLEFGKAMFGIGDQASNEVSAAEMGKQTASVYTDYVNRGVKAGNFDPVTGKMKEVGKEAGDVFGEGFLQKLKDAKVSEAIGALIYDAAGNVQMSDDAALSIINSQTGPAKSFKKLSDEFNILGQKWTYLESTTDQSKFKSVVGPQGNVVDIGQARKMYALTSTGQMTTSWGDFKDVGESASESIAKTYYDELKGSIKSSASFMETQYSGMSDDLGNVMADGIFKPMEKRQLEVYDKLLDIYKTEFPLEFGVEETKLQAEIKAAIIGPWDVNINIDTGEAEADFEVWLLEKAALFEAQLKNTGIMPIREEQRKRWEFEQTATPAQMKYLAGIDKAATSDEPGAISGAKTYAKALLDSEPALKKTAWATQELGSVQVETNQHFKLLNGVLVALDESGAALPGIFADTAVVIPALGTGIINLTATVENAAARFNAITLSSGNRQWAQSMISDSAINNAFLGTYGKSLASTTGFNTAKVATESDFGGLLSGKLGMNIPKLGQVSRVLPQSGGGLGLLGENGEEEWVLPVSAIKGLWPQSAKVDMGSINYKPFLDYPAPEIRAPPSYMWSQFPNAPNVSEKNTDAIQTAWLSDKQLNSRDIYSGQIRDMQLASIGKSQVIPWFARGDIKQPDWWTEAATKLSPQYKENWEANKGGTVPAIGKDTTSSAISSIATKNGITVADAWSQLYGESFTEGCIKTNSPDDSLIFTPSAGLISEIGRTWGQDATAAWNQLYGEAFTEGCIGTNKPSDLLKYIPSASMLSETARAQGGAWGSQLVWSNAASADRGIESTLGNIEKNTAKSADKIGLAATYTGQMASILKSPIQGFDNGNPFGTLSGGTASGEWVPAFGAGSDALVTGLSKEGYVVTYDPRTDTCEGLPFNPPDPSLKTTDKFYLGIGNEALVNESYDESYGWGGRTGWTDDPNLQQLQKIGEQSYKEQQQAAKDTAKIEKNTRELSSDMKASMSGKGYDSSGALVTLGGGGGAWGMNGGQGGTYGSYFGGWLSGGAAGVGVQQAGESQPSWMPGWTNQAEGGFADSATPIIFGEAGREAFVPISDRAAGLRILPQVMRELGVRQFAQGGFSGNAGSNISADIMRPMVFNHTTNVNGSGLSESKLRQVLKDERKQMITDVARKFKQAGKR